MSVRERIDDARVGAVYLVIGLALVLLAPGARTQWWPAAPPAVWVDLAVLALACCGQVFRRNRPLLGLLVGVLALLAGGFPGETHVSVVIVVADLLYCVALNGSERVSRAVCWTGGALAIAVGVATFVSNGTQAAVQTLVNVTVIAVPVLWGREVRHHRAQAHTERDRAEAATRMAELDRAAAVAAERARMARDLHDVIAGQLSGIAIQSEAALTIADAGPEVLRRVLADVRRDSVASLAEMRTMIGLLRADHASEPRTAPAGLAQLDALVDAARRRGLDIEIDDRRGEAPVPAAVDLAAYRIVQESLTNAAKHAPGARVRLTLRADADSLLLEVRNDETSRSPAAGGTGTGLLGLRERAASIGVGSTPDGSTPDGSTPDGSTGTGRPGMGRHRRRPGVGRARRAARRPSGGRP